jgi:hypothetical protein
MKSGLIFLIALVLSLQSGCDQSTQPTGKEVCVSIEIESDFQNDAVRLYLDYTTILEERITTNPVLSLAWSSGLRKLSNDSHFLNFAVTEYGVLKTFNVDLANDTSTVTINFDKSTKQIRFQQYKGILLRD